MAYNMKKLRGCMVLVLVFYTILVTYFLALTAWSDDVTEGEGRDESLLKVLYQEERRHLRSFKDVIKSYGGLRQAKHTGVARRNQEDGHSQKGAGAKDRSRQDNVYVEGKGSNSLHKDNSTSSNSTGVKTDGSVGDLPSSVKTNDSPAIQLEAGSLDNSAAHLSLLPFRDPRHVPDTGNIFIEDNIPGPSPSNTSTTSHRTNAKTTLFKAKKALANGRISSSQTSSKDSQIQASLNGNNYKKNYSDATTTRTQYCDKLDAEEPHLCLTERITFTHRQHVNISQIHLSFKTLGDINIYSAFLDTRRKTAVIRLMVIGPRDRDGVKASGYWCAYTLPAHVAPQYAWNGLKMNATATADQATQLDYYAASVGHAKMSQFYIMSCAVPERHISVLQQSDSSRIHILVGGKDSPLLKAVQERIAVDVINNQGLPWHQVVSELSKEKNVSDVNNTSITQKESVSKLNGHIPNSDSKAKNVMNSPSSPEFYQSSYVTDSLVSCVAPVLANVGIIQLIEFIELTLLLGSHHIILYMNHMTKDIRDVLSVYQNSGLISLLPWSIPDPPSIWANGRDVALNDCLYRTMYRYEYALFHDMDEYFVPRVTPDLPSFINFLKSKGGLKPHKISDIVFSSAYFSPPTKLQLKNLATLAGYSRDVGKFSTLRSLHRTYFNQHHAVRIIRPVMAYRVGAGERKKTLFNISPRYAGVNHYSQCVDSSGVSDASALAKANVPSQMENKKPVVNLPGAIAAAAAATANKIDPKSEVSCNSTKVDMFLWRMKDRLIRQTKQSIRDINAKRRG